MGFSERCGLAGMVRLAGSTGTRNQLKSPKTTIPWHYIISLRRPADADHISAASFSIPPTNILWALSHSLVTLKDQRPLQPTVRSAVLGDASVGDLHQPSTPPHSCRMPSLKATRRQSDRCGRCQPDPIEPPFLLDQMFGMGVSFENIQQLPDQIADAPQYTPRNLRDTRKRQEH